MRWFNFSGSSEIAEIIERLRQKKEAERLRNEEERLRQEELQRQEEELRRQGLRDRRDWLAVIVAFAAAAFTLWQAWEAHQTRKDTNVQFERAQQRADRDAENARQDAIRAREDSQAALALQSKAADRSAEQAKRSADAATLSNKLAVNAMQQSQRPWIGPNLAMPVKTNALEIKQNGMIVTYYELSARSYGNCAANNVQFHAELMVAQDITTIWDKEKKVCDFTTGNPQIGKTLFPSQERVMTNAWPALATSIVPNTHAVPKQKEFQVFLLTCIGYRDQFGKLGTPHHTGTIYRRASSVDGESVVFEIKPNTQIPGEWREWYSFLD